jgi:hypothetical protein
VTWLHTVIDVPAGGQQAAADFWSRALGWPLGVAWDGHPELRSFEPPRGAAYVHLQQVEGPPRVHVDVELADPDAGVAHAVKLGAALVDSQDRWQTLRSPGGLPFCVLKAVDREAPGPVTLGDGHRLRMVQVCIDAPPALHDAEIGFWRALLGGRWVPSPRPEFAGKWHDDDGSPVQLLFQRLDDDQPRVLAHLDLGTDDLQAEVRRLLDLGATDVGPGRGGWHVLRDVTGQLFCATENSPEQTRRRDLG